jgi:hypothetical protein
MYRRVRPYRKSDIKMVRRQRLDFDVQHLAATIHSVGRVDAVRAVECTVLSVYCQLWKRKLNRTAALTAALLGLFAFWLSHGMCVLD